MINNSFTNIDNPMYRLDKKRHHRFEYRNEVSAYVMLAPAFILLTIFVVIPLIMAVIRSFQDYNTKAFVGFYNYEFIFETDLFVKSFGNVLIMTAVITVVMIIISFLFANVLKAMNNKFGDIAKVIIYIPFFISGIAASVIFTLITNYGGGLISSILVSMGLDPISFTSDTVLAYVSIIIPTIWLGFGYNTLVMYAGLINIPSDYYAAASIDGANWWQKVIHITIPNMRNTMVLLVVNLVTTNMQMMEIPMIMTEGGPLNETLTPVLYLFNAFRDPSRPANATIAGSIVVMIVIMSVNIIVFRLVHSKRSEDA
jgi:ABC-type sugar transport system permease subunit